MGDSLKLVNQLLELGKKYNLRALKALGIEIEFGPHLVEDPRYTKPIADEEKAPSEDQMLFWSAGGLDDDEIRAKPAS